MLFCRLRELDNLNNFVRELEKHLNQEVFNLKTTQRATEVTQEALREQVSSLYRFMLSISHTVFVLYSAH